MYTKELDTLYGHEVRAFGQVAHIGKKMKK